MGNDKKNACFYLNMIPNPPRWSHLDLTDCLRIGVQQLEHKKKVREHMTIEMNCKIEVNCKMGETGVKFEVMLL